MMPLSKTDSLLCERIRDTVRIVEPSAECILFGSRARGDAREDSDWDILVLLEGEITDARKRRIRYTLYDLEFEVGMVLASKVLDINKLNWNSNLISEKSTA